MSVLPLDEGSGLLALDTSGNGNDGTLLNGASFEANTGDGSPYSVHFDGIDDVIDLGGVDVNGAALTLASWFNADSFPGPSSDPRLISKATGTAANDHLFMLGTIRVGSAVRLRARVRVGGTTTTLIASNGDLQPGEWRHAAMTYDGTTLRLYLDAAEVGSTPLSGAVDMNPSVPLAVGAQPAGAGARYFDGLIDDVRVLQRALSAVELAQIIDGGNRLPIAVDDSYQVQPDTALIVGEASGVLSNDSDPESDPLQAFLLSGPASGVLNLNPDGSFDYTPNSSFSGQDSFTYRANDGEANSNPATVTILVIGANDPDALSELPLDEGSGTLATDLSGKGNNGTLLNGASYEANTGDGSPYSVRFDGVDDFIDLGAVDVNGTGLTLAAWFNADTFPGPSSDPRLISKATGTGANDHLFMLGTIRLGSAVRLRARVRVGGSTTTLIASSGDLQPGVWRHAALTYDGTTLRLYLDTAEVGSTPLSGAVDMDPSVPLVVGAQPPGAGARYFDGLIDDVRVLQRALGTIELNQIYEGGNQQPIAADDTYQVLPDTALIVSTANGVLSNDSDPDLDPLQAFLVSNPLNGVLNLNPDGSFDYAPNSAFSGQDSFTYEANDGEGSSSPATVTILVAAPPTAVTDEYMIDEDSTLEVSASIGVLANDIDNNPPDDLTATLVTSPSNASLMNFASDGSFTYVPQLNFNGADSFIYEAVDSATGATDQVTVSLTVNPINDAPVAGDDSYQVEPDTVLVATTANGVLSNDSDADFDLIQALLPSSPSNGVLNLNPDGSFDYTPNSGFSGQDSFTYQASDDQATSGPATVTISVVAEPTSNSAPRIVSGAVSFDSRIIATGVDATHAVVAAELTGDSDIDAVSTDYVDGALLLHANDGNGGFLTSTLDVNLAGAYPAHVGDVDGDGDADLLAGGYLADTFAWYENLGSGNFLRRDIDTLTDGPHSIVTVDMDGDGDIDLLTTSQDANVVAWYENNGANVFTRNIVDTTAMGAKRAEAADLDGDGDIDIASASFFNDEIAWHENDGSQNFTKRVIDNSADGAYYVSIADVDGDSDFDLFTASQLDNTIAWYRNDGPGGFSFNRMDGGAGGARTVIPADIDGDGDVDAVSASVNDDTIAWFQNDGAGSFTKQGIDVAALGAYGAFAVDMDRDGDLDVLSSDRDANAVSLHTQIAAHSLFVDPESTITIDTAQLRTVDPDDGPAELTYTIVQSPALGNLQVGGIPVGVNGTFTQADVDANRLTYTHSGQGTSADSFAFEVADGGENGVQPASGFFTINVGFAGPLVLLPLDEGSGTVALDASGNGNDGVLLNGASYEANTGDGSPYSVRFDGTDDAIDLGAVDVNGSGLTLASWFNADGFPGPSSDPRLISKATGTAANDHLFMLGTIRVGSAIRLRARVRVGGTTTTLIASSGDLQPGAWRHAAVTYDGTTLRLYLDAVEVGSVPLSGAVDMNPSVPLFVGAQPPGAGARYFDGLIDDVRVLQRALSAVELSQIVGGGT